MNKTSSGCVRAASPNLFLKCCSLPIIIYLTLFGSWVTIRIKTLQQQLRVSDQEGRIRVTVDSTLQEDLEVLKSGAEGEKVTSLSLCLKLSLAQCQRLIAVSRSMRTFCDCSESQVCRYPVSGLSLRAWPLVTSAESPPLTLGAGVSGGGY